MRELIHHRVVHRAELKGGWVEREQRNRRTQQKDGEALGN